MRRLDWSTEWMGRLRWILPALLLLTAVGWEAREVFVLEKYSVSFNNPELFMEPLQEVFIFVMFCALLWVALHQVYLQLQLQEKAVQEARQRAQRVAALGDVMRGLVAITDPRQLLQHVWEDLQQVIDFDQGIFFRYQTASERLEAVAWRGFTEEEAHKIATRSMERHPGWVVRHKQPILVGDTESDSRVRYFRTTKRSASLLQVPVLDGDRCLGVIGLGSNQKYAFSGEDLAMVAAFADSVTVTLRNAELFQEMRESKEQWETTFNAITDGISIHDREFRTVRANQALANLLGKPLEEIVGQPCYRVFHGCNEPMPGCPLAKTLEMAQPATLECEETLQGRTLRVMTYPVMNGAGRPTGGVHIVHDVTDENRVQQQMRQMEKLSAIGQLVAGVAHEINNPLQGIVGFSELLARDHALEDKERAADHVNRIRREADRVRRIVQNLLSFARQHDPQHEPTSINDLLQRVLEFRLYPLRTGNIELHTDLEPSLPTTTVDPYQLQQMFLNLVINAEQAMTNTYGGGNLTIRSRLTGKDTIRVEIEDDGPGIPEEHISKVFDPFFTTKEVGQGTGLGLSICYGIVQEHNGRIWIESPVHDRPTKYGPGTRFVTEFPLQKSSWAAEMLVADQKAKAGLTTKPLHILVVDDEEAVTSLLANVLGEEGHQVDHLDQAEKALAHLEQTSYDLIFCDLKMPGIGGRGFYEQLASRNPSLAKQVVFITGDTSSSTSRTFLEGTGQPFLEKPFAVQDLYRLVHNMQSV